MRRGHLGERRRGKEGWSGSAIWGQGEEGVGNRKGDGVQTFQLPLIYLSASQPLARHSGGTGVWPRRLGLGDWRGTPPPQVCALSCPARAVWIEKRVCPSYIRQRGATMTKASLI